MAEDGHIFYKNVDVSFHYLQNTDIQTRKTYNKYRQGRIMHFSEPQMTAAQQH